MIHMPKGAKVLKYLFSHKEKLEKAASPVKLSEECSAIIQRNLPQKEGDPGSFTLLCLIGPLAEQWVDTVNHDRKWTKDEEEEDSNEVLAVSFYPRIEPVEPLEWKAPENRLKSSSVEPPKLELKELPEHLEYAFLQKDNQLPVVISSTLSTVKKARLLEVIPKKGGMIVVKNEKDELIPQQTVTEWRVCIDYRKLNNATQKDHFLLPFIDQMIERLVGHEYYCFLDAFSGYFQIPIAPEDHEKTTFTCPYGTFAYKRMPFGL
ncbi:RNA-directed DNA polymerase [Tanacetum coccineum]